MIVRQRFTPLQRLLHWLMAVCILAMLFIGVGMVSTIMPKYLRIAPVATLVIAGAGSGKTNLVSTLLSVASLHETKLLRLKRSALAWNGKPMAPSASRPS